MTKEKQTKGESPKEEKKVGMVEIPQSQLENLLKRMDGFENDKNMLLQIADKKQLALFYQRNQGKIPSKVMLRTMIVRQDPKVEDSPLVEKVIVGWRTVKDIVQPDPITPLRWIEDQKVELLFDDGTSSGEMHLAQFVRNYKQVAAEVRSRMVDEVSGNIALKVVRTDNGREYTIGVEFVN